MRRIGGASRAWILGLAIVTAAHVGDAGGQETAEEEARLGAETLRGLTLRSLGPALTSGRIGDLAIDPRQRKVYYVAVASGGVWKTTNAGTTWTPIFDDQGSYSIGCITLDPNDPLVVWVGTGENNSQRSVGYGDGVYKSVDGGSTWENVGLRESEHIGKIVIDPRDSNVVFVAAQGPLWRSGGDRGLFKSTDGGKTWNGILEIDEHTGVSDLVMDPRDPDVLYAAAYQRRRRVWTLINGGPGSAIYKSTDGGDTWRELEKGLPEEEMGRIGLAVAPSAPDTVYAIVEAAGEGSGFYRSVDGGSTWEKRSDYVSDSPQYYQEIVPDPHDPDRVYSLDTWLHVTEDGGASFREVGERHKHVDNHALWIDPEDSSYLLAGCDGGLYESFDRGTTWRFKPNLPVTQFYKITVDNDEPFYNVYGGTQDNFTLGGPSRTTHTHGISNRDWFVTLGGDGFQPRVDPENPDIVYSQWQYGHLNRFDRRSGELLDIRPRVGPEEDPLRFNWDAPLLISPHAPTRLYYAAQRVFRSEDRGRSWEAISPDLTRQIDRNRLEVMGRVWSIDAVAKNASTSFYGNIVALDESPRVEGLLYAGTDDGLVQVREPEGEGWRRMETFPSVPDRTYVNDLLASRHDPDTVYAAFNNHKSGDFRPYVLRSRDRGRTWTSISGGLPDRGSVYAVEEDHLDPSLLFVGTEFGLFVTTDGGERWVELQGGMPTIAVRDLEIQRREGDLVVGTFGRGIYVLDDYSPLRGLTEEVLQEEGVLFPVRRALRVHLSSPLGVGEGFQGDSFYTAPNPPPGALVTYYLREKIRSRREARREEEKQALEEGETISIPSWDELRTEDRELPPAVVLTIEDSDGRVVRRLVGPVEAGFHRLGWDLRWSPPHPTSLEEPEYDPFAAPPRGPVVVPGHYRVRLAKRVDGEMTPLGEPRSFEVVPAELATLPAEDVEALSEFRKRVARLQRAVLGAVRAAAETQERIDLLKQAFLDTPGAAAELGEEILAVEERLADLRIELEGDTTVRRRNEPTPRSIVERVEDIVAGSWSASPAPSEAQTFDYEVAARAFGPVLESLRVLVEEDLEDLEARLESAGAPWTPGRVPSWQPQ